MVAREKFKDDMREEPYSKGNLILVWVMPEIMNILETPEV